MVFQTRTQTLAAAHPHPQPHLHGQSDANAHHLQTQQSSHADPSPDLSTSQRTIRLFLHSWLKLHVADETVTTRLYRACYNAHNMRSMIDDATASRKLSEFLRTVDKTLEPLDMAFKSLPDPRTGAKVWAMINTNGDAVAGLATTYTLNELNYFKKLIQLIMTSKDGKFTLPSSLALKATSDIKPAISKRDGELLIESFVRDGWLDDRQGLITLSLRSCLELSVYLKETFPNRIVYCTGCQNFAFHFSDACPSETCPARLHYNCARLVWPSSSNPSAPSQQRVCPVTGCGTAWQAEGKGSCRLKAIQTDGHGDEDDAGEDDDEGEEEEEGMQVDGEEEEGDDDDEDEDMQSGREKSKRRQEAKMKKSRLSGLPPVDADDMDRTGASTQNVEEDEEDERPLVRKRKTRQS